MRPLTRRLLTAVALTASMGVALAGCTKTDAVTADDMSQGNPNSKVTVIEYASATCSHCARWNTEVYPAFKAKYVDTGKVNSVSREILTAPAEVAAASFLIFLSVLRSDLANWSATFSSPEEEPFFEAPLSTALK